MFFSDNWREKSTNAPYLVTSTFLEKTDAAAITRLVNRILQNFWPQFNESLLLLMLSDAAAYMIKAGKDLKVFYPSMIHITCFAHALHRVCEQVREMFKEVNDLISAVKKVFLKAPSHIKIWKDHCGFLPRSSAYSLGNMDRSSAILCFPL